MPERKLLSLFNNDYAPGVGRNQSQAFAVGGVTGQMHSLANSDSGGFNGERPRLGDAQNTSDIQKLLNQKQVEIDELKRQLELKSQQQLAQKTAALSLLKEGVE